MRLPIYNIEKIHRILLRSIRYGKRKLTPIFHKIKKSLFLLYTGKFTIAKTRNNKPKYLITSLVSTIVLGTIFYVITSHAASTPYTWDFSSSGDYILSDSSNVEITSNKTRLKVLEYSSDDNTVGLYHLNESEGQVVADSSSYSNSGSSVNTNWSTSGNLFNNAYDFNGTSDFIEVKDSASLSITQANTLEAWFKLSGSFTSTSSSNKMGIIDKGNYKLYLDNETGKLTYELTPSTQTNWTQVAGGNTLGDAVLPGSWDLNGQIAVSALIQGSGSDVYAGVGSPIGTAGAAGDAEVWKWNGSAWTKIGGDGTGNSPSTLGWDASNYEEVTSLTFINGTLYAALSGSTGDAEVWSYNGSQWTFIGGDGVNSSWAASTYESVHALASSGSYVYAGLGTGAGDAEVWRWNGSSWLQIGGTTSGNWGTANYDSAMSLVVDGSYLYAGLGVTAGEAEVWRWTLSTATCNGNPCTWTKIGGDGTGWGSGGTSTYEVVQSMASDGTNLYVGLALSTGDADVYMYNGSSWSLIGGNGTGWADTIYEYVSALTVSGSTLYAGLGSGNNEADVFKYENSTWSQIGGGTEVTTGWNNNAYQRIRALVYSENSLFVGTQLTLGSGTTYYGTGDLWRLTSGTWATIGGNYINNSWGYSGLNSVESMVQVGEYLYIGTGQNSSAVNVGDALVYKFDGSTWTLIGGQGINSGWAANTYETVQTMAGYNGDLYVGLGSSTGDAEVWKWDGESWLKVAGDGTGWGVNTYEIVSSMISHDGYLFAGLGNTNGQSDGEIYRYDGANWTRIGGDGSGSSPSRYGWASGAPGPYEVVLSMSIHKGDLYAGLGNSTNDAEVWKYSDNGTAADTTDDTWTKIGGDSINSGWTTGGYAEVSSLAVFRGDLYAGLGSAGGAAEVWKWNGSAWSKVGGDGTGDSPSTLGWTADAPGPYERVRSMVVYNGELYASLGDTAGDGEVWRYDGTQWTKVGGDSLRDSWSANIEYVNTMVVYKGVLYAGTGNTNNADAAVFAYGGNVVLQSDNNEWPDTWYHVIASYDGSTMRLKVEDSSGNSIVNSSSAATLFLADASTDLLIGSTQGEDKKRGGQGYFQGIIDEVRISKSYRSSYTKTPYSSDPQTVQNSLGRWSDLDGGGVGQYLSFNTSESAGSGSIKFRLSSNGGSTWKYWGGSDWTTSSSLSNVNTQSTINDHIDDFPISDDGIVWQAVLDGDGTTTVELNSVTISGVEDNENPTTPTSLTALSTTGSGVTLSASNWYPFETPYFSWEGATDNGSAGVAGYFVYFGTSNSGDLPEHVGNFQTSTTYIPTNLQPNTTYYLKIQTKDKAQNTSDVYDAFVYKFDNAGPNTPSSLSVSPVGYASTNSFSFTWSSTSDPNGSTLAGYQYQTNEEVDENDWSETTTDTSVTIPNAAYQVGTNYFYLVAIDNAGNRSTPISKTFLYGGAGPSVPRLLRATQESNTVNSFSFQWDAPESYSGNESDLKYCYTVNVLPNANTCNYTAAGIKALSEGPCATAQGINILYVVAKNPESSGGAINYGNYASVAFEANTAAPGIPQTTEVADVSVKSTESWKLAISWESPEDTGSGISNYQIWHSLDDETYEEVATTTGIAYVDTGLTQVLHYYKIRACDSVDNCGVFTEPVSLLPTGKYTDPPSLSSDPEVSAITTKKATISWSTDRTCDSKVSYGTSAGNYYDEEPSNSDQVTSHSITLTSLSPGKKYYYVAKWTDEDGNTGTSEEDSFTTQAAPTVSDVKVKVLGINNVTLEFTTQKSSLVKIYYGETSAFGGVKEISTSTAKTTYITNLENLKDGTKYYYKVNTFDSESEEYEGTILDFTTLPLPRISDVRIQQIKGTAQPSVFISWNTNTEISSIASFYPEGNPAGVRDEVNVSLTGGAHKLILRNLLPQTKYLLTVSGRDIAGNEASSEVQRFTTATDTRAPLISGLNVEASSTLLVGSGESQSQLVVSWDTDEAATSQVEFGEGAGTSYSQKTQEDSNLTFNHMVIVTGLTPSKVYHLRALSKDSAGNLTQSIDTVAITPKAAENALDLVITNLQSAFGFIKGAGK